MKMAIMQPYLFPYIGYYQLLKASDVFAVYDDVNYIKRGWINRNRILINGKDSYFTLPCKKISQNRLINEIEVDFSSGYLSKFFKTIEQGYQKTPYYNEVIGIISEIMSFNENNLALFLLNSIKKMAGFLNIDCTIEQTSIEYPESKGIGKADRLIAICSKKGASDYINAIGGTDLYSKEYFKERGISLYFLKSGDIIYRQNSKEFVANLSIIDSLMYAGKKGVSEALNKYKLI